MGGKHQKLLLGNNATGKCLQANMQICSARSPLFAESAFFHTKIKNLSWNRWIYEPMGQNTKNYSWATMPQAKCLLTPTCKISESALAQKANEEKFAESAFFHTKNQKPVMKPLNLRANRGKTPNTTLGQQFPWQVRSGPHATFLQP